MELTDLDQIVDSHSGCKKLYRFMSQDIKAMHILDLKVTLFNSLGWGISQLLQVFQILYGISIQRWNRLHIDCTSSQLFAWTFALHFARPNLRSRER